MVDLQLPVCQTKSPVAMFLSGSGDLYIPLLQGQPHHMKTHIIWLFPDSFRYIHTWQYNTWMKAPLISSFPQKTVPAYQTESDLFRRHHTSQYGLHPE